MHSLNGMTPIFSQFGQDIYASDVVQQAVYCIVSEMKKLTPKHIRRVNGDVQPVTGVVQSILDNPNPLMTTSEMIEKIIWQLFFNYNSFILPTFNSSGDLDGLWPLNPTQVDFLQDRSDNIYVKFRFANEYESTVPYSKLIHLKYKYSVNEFMGGNEIGQPDNGPLLETLSINDTLLKGVAKAMKSSFSINGVIKYNTLLDGEKTDEAIKQLEEHLRNNEHGFLPLDLKGEFIPFPRDVKLIDKDTLEFIDGKILRHFGVSLPILTGDFTPAQMAAFYQKTLEPLIISMSQAFTRGIFTTGERSHKNEIQFYPEELMFMSIDQKLEMVRLLGDSGALYENEKRTCFGLKPLAELNGVRIQSLNYLNTQYAAQYQLNQQNSGTTALTGTGTGMVTDPTNGGTIISEGTIGDIARKPLTATQLATLYDIVTKYKEGQYDYSQAKTMITIGIGVTAAEADAMLGAQDELDEKLKNQQQQPAQQQSQQPVGGVSNGQEMVQTQL